MIDSAVAAAGPDVRSFSIEADVSAPREEVWLAWTSAEQVGAWWGPPKLNIDFRIGCAFEILFNMDIEEGLQGSEGCVYLGYVPNEMISFTWNAPPHLVLRKEHTWVVITFAPSEHGTTVKLTHTGFLTGPDWDDYVEYFQSAWAYVLNLLKSHWA
jgi:uncharacterized protein YndB with AHSA1/START domain